MTSSQQQDIKFLAQAIQLAKNGLYTTGSNPRVGCVITKNGKMIGSGWHQQAGQAHAEINALNSISKQDDAEGACAYVSLEPCSHQGKTGPCADALVKAGVTRVVCAMQDPAKHVSGKGIAKLKGAGIEVDCGLLASEAEALNPGFIKRATQQLPFVRVKMAMSVDGRTAMSSGESQWITGNEARLDVQQWRAQSNAIITGIETVLSDDPMMTIRPDESWATPWPTEVPLVQPLRVVVDSHLRFPLDALMLNDKGKIIIATTSNDKAKTAALTDVGVEVWCLPSANADRGEGNGVDCLALLKRLAEIEINEVWVESGATLAGAFMEENLFDELVLYVAPTLLGSSAKPLFSMTIDKMSEKKQLILEQQRMIGDDIRYIYTA